MFDTMQNPEAGEATNAEVAAMTGAGYAPGRYLAGEPQWYNDYHPLDAFRAGYALARDEAEAATRGGQDIAVPSEDVLLDAIEFVLAPYYGGGGLGEITDRDAVTLASGLYAHLRRQADKHALLDASTAPVPAQNTDGTGSAPVKPVLIPGRIPGLPEGSEGDRILERASQVPLEDVIATLNGLSGYPVLNLHLMSAHAFSDALEMTKAEAEAAHAHEHRGPGTIRNHDPEDRTWKPWKVLNNLLDVVFDGEGTLPTIVPHLRDTDGQKG